MLAAEQRATTRRALQEKFGDRHLNLSLERLEFLRRRALEEESAGEPVAPGALHRAFRAKKKPTSSKICARPTASIEAAAFARAGAHHADRLHARASRSSRWKPRSG